MVRISPQCPKCGRNHRSKCLAGSDGCFKCGKLGHYSKECRVKNVRPHFPPCDKCGRNHKGECMAGKEGCYKCGDMGHKQRDCPVATRIGRERKVRETKRARIEEGLSLDGFLVPNDKVSKSSQVHEGTSSGKL